MDPVGVPLLEVALAFAMPTPTPATCGHLAITYVCGRGATGATDVEEQHSGEVYGSGDLDVAWGVEVRLRTERRKG